MHEFIPNFAETAKPLYSLLEKGGPWLWTPACQDAYERLNKAATSAPILRNPDRPFTIEVDASEVAIGAILLQEGEESGKLHPCAFFSRVLKDPELNYSTADKELLAIVSCLKRWRCYMEGSHAKSTIITDSQSAASFLYKNMSELPSARDARWLSTLQRFNVVMRHVKAEKNSRAD
jgi:hypothetical protein